MFKHHPKVYEEVFSSDRPGSPTALKTSLISFDGMGNEEFASKFHSFFKDDFMSGLFGMCVKLSWLRRKFRFNGRKMVIPFYLNSQRAMNAFTKFMRRYVGNDIQVITKTKIFARLELFYLDQLFPGFEDGDPFKDPDSYTFPFKNISLEYLMVVTELDDRIDLLKYVDEHKMSYAVFLDYVLNHILVENDLLGKTRYEMPQGTSRSSWYYVRDKTKQFKPGKGSKRT